MSGRRARGRSPVAMARTPLRSPREVIDDALTRHSGPQLFAVPDGARPAEDVPEQAFPRGENPYPAKPGPSFTPAPPRNAAMTAPQQAYRPRLPGTHPARAVIHDQVSASMLIAELSPPPAPPAAGDGTALYCAPGWAGMLMRLRIRNEEWEELPRLVEEAMGRNAAEAATALRHSREKIAEAARQFCTGTGHPEMLRGLLDRVSELNAAGGAR